MAELRPDIVHVWYLETRKLDQKTIKLLQTNLAPDELARMTKFHFDKDRKLYIAAHALVRKLLQYFGELHARDWKFSKGEHGKPHVINPNGGPKYCTNLSHTEGMVVAAITINCEVGIDVESLRRDVEIDTLAKRVCSEFEKNQLAELTGWQKKKQFLTYWTLKEAYVKAIGKGISFPVETLRFHTSEAQTRLFLENPNTGGTFQKKWQFHRQTLPPDCLMALAVPSEDVDRLHIIVEPAPLDYLLASKL